MCLTKKSNSEKGKSYLHNLLTPYFKAIEPLTEELDFDTFNTDSVTEDRTESVSSSQMAVTTGFEMLLTRFTDVIDEIPQEMVLVCSEVSRIVSRKFGVVGVRAFLSGYFFLRFVAPSLMGPQVFFYTPFSLSLSLSLSLSFLSSSLFSFGTLSSSSLSLFLDFDERGISEPQKILCNGK